MPATCLIAGALIIKTCAMRCQLQENQNQVEPEGKSKVKSAKGKARVTPQPRTWKSFGRRWRRSTSWKLRPIRRQIQIPLISFLYCLSF
ncbi:hypothetical protein MTP99_001073 [Tenebrio molitor]|nr:hypothetical protein MTP99_001073 [Tenebrio molitor]